MLNKEEVLEWRSRLVRAYKMSREENLTIARLKFEIKIHTLNELLGFKKSNFRLYN